MRPEYTINPERRALYRRQGFWGDATLADYWHQSVRAVPDRTCVVDSQGGRYTYAQLDKKAQRLAGWMRTIGVGRGDVVALNLPGWAEFTIAYVAALKLGAIAMPLLPAWREAELSWALDWCEAKVVFTATAFRKSRPIEMLAKLAQHLPRLSAVVAVEKWPRLPRRCVRRRVFMRSRMSLPARNRSSRRFPLMPMKSRQCSSLQARKDAPRG